MALGFLNFPIFGNSVKITLDDFLLNPAGRGSSMLARRQEIKKNLQLRYYELIKKYGNFKFSVYNLNEDTYIFYFKIPSETYKEISYDILLEFSSYKEKDNRDSNSLLGYGMKFFSNSPHMMMTYTYVLNKENLLVPFIKRHKCSDRALKEPPKTRNPIGVFGFEKSCYFAALFISEQKYYLKSNLTNLTKRFDNSVRTSMLKTIMHQETKLVQYNTIKQKYIDERKQEKAKKLDERSNAQFSGEAKQSVAKREKLESKKDKKVQPVKRVKSASTRKNKILGKVNESVDMKVNMKVDMKVKNSRIHNKLNMKV